MQQPKQPRDDDARREDLVGNSGFRNSTVARFVPALATCMVWFYLVSYSHGPLDVHVYTAEHNVSTATGPLGSLWDELFKDYYPMTLAMIPGSLIAGSTPLGGGVVAFPVAVLGAAQ